MSFRQSANNAPPLTRYAYTSNATTIHQILDHPVSGGVTLNSTIGQKGLPFGGIGPSFMGAYHAHFIHNPVILSFRFLHHHTAKTKVGPQAMGIK